MSNQNMIYCFSTVTMVTRTRLSVTFIVDCLCCCKSDLYKWGGAHTNILCGVVIRGDLQLRAGFAVIGLRRANFRVKSNAEQAEVVALSARCRFLTAVNSSLGYGSVLALCVLCS